MRLLSRAKDGGQDSTVTGYWLIEIKKLFSIVLLKFEDGSREVFHEHAFNSWSWLLKGKLKEYIKGYEWPYTYYPSLVEPIVTKRETYHMVRSVGTSWVLSFRGPWRDTWKEYRNTPYHHEVTLTHGRREV